MEMNFFCFTSYKRFHFLSKFSFDLSSYKFNYKFSFFFQNFVMLVLMYLTIDNFERRFFERDSFNVKL